MMGSQNLVSQVLIECVEFSKENIATIVRQLVPNVVIFLYHPKVHSILGCLGWVDGMSSLSHTGGGDVDDGCPSPSNLVELLTNPSPAENKNIAEWFVWLNPKP